MCTLVRFVGLVAFRTALAAQQAVCSGQMPWSFVSRANRNWSANACSCTYHYFFSPAVSSSVGNAWRQAYAQLYDVIMAGLRHLASAYSAACSRGALEAADAARRLLPTDLLRALFL